jgi:hypothetical protein
MANTKPGHYRVPQVIDTAPRAMRPCLSGFGKPHRFMTSVYVRICPRCRKKWEEQQQKISPVVHEIIKEDQF